MHQGSSRTNDQRIACRGHEEGLLCRDELEALAKEYPSFQFMPTLTRPNPQWHGRVGPVQEHLDEALALYSPDDLKEVDVYICGLHDMVQSVRKELLDRGFDRKQIISEGYD